MKAFKTVYHYGEAEWVVEKSRFIGYVMPVETEEEALIFIEKIKKQHRNATHNVPVYILGEMMSVQLYSDDGEPSGTAGLPVLEMLKKEGLTNLCIVMTRYYGGIKLGTGGLVRAYTATAKIALEAGLVVEKGVYETLVVTIDYTLHGKVQNSLTLHPSVVLADVAFTDVVSMTIYLPPEDSDAFILDLKNLTAGKLTWHSNGLCHLILKDGELITE